MTIYKLNWVLFIVFKNGNKSKNRRNSKQIKMGNIDSIMPIITLNVNELNTTIKREV